MPNPELVGVATGLVANGLTSLGHHVLSSSRDLKREAELLRGNVKQPDVERALDFAFASLLDPLPDPGLGGERLRAFLGSPEARQTMRQIYGGVLTGSPTAVANAELSFTRLLVLWTEIPAAAAQNHGPRLFAALRVACDQALSAAIERGSLQALDAAAHARNRILQDELANLADEVKLLTSADRLDAKEIDEFATLYRKQVTERETMITLPSLDDKIQWPVSQVYVEPRLHRDGVSVGSTPLADTLDTWRRTVVLGSPGAGKSTLLSHIIEQMTSGTLTIENGTVRMPLLVILREYAEAKRRNSLSIVEFIERQAASRYQVARVPARAVDYVLRHAQAYVLFDGLDELLDTSDRAEISQDVMSFASMYPTAPIIVTSRVIGYSSAPLRPDLFERWQIAALDESAVATYAHKMISADVLVPVDRRRELHAAFLTKSSGLGSLRANPLMLALLVRLFLKTKDLPVHRAGVLEACALLLFERWDNDRGIFVPFKFKSRLRPAIQYLAHEIFSGRVEVDAGEESDGTQQRTVSGGDADGVTRQWLVNLTRDYLLGRRYDNTEDATEAAEEFVDLCRGRAWVFAEVGTSRHGEALFSFAHRTFMEYFVAGFFTSHHATPQALLDALTPHIAMQEWEVVCQLAFHIRAGEQASAANELLMGVLDAVCRDALIAERLPVPSWDSALHVGVSFCARALSALVPDLSVLEVIARAWLTGLVGVLVEAAESPSRRETKERDQRIVELVTPFADCNFENVHGLCRPLGRGFRDLAASGAARLMVRGAFELALNLDAHAGTNGASRMAWVRGAGEIAEENASVLRAFAADDKRVAYDAVRSGILGADEMVRRHGYDAILTRRPLRSLRSASRDPLARWLLECVMRRADDADSAWVRSNAMRNLGELAGVIPERPVHVKKWRGDEPVFVPVRQWLDFGARELTPMTELSADQLYAALCITAALHDSDPASWRDAGLAGDGPENQGSVLAAVVDIVRRRPSRDGDTPLLAAPYLLPAHADTLYRWVNGWRRFSD